MGHGTHRARSRRGTFGTRASILDFAREMPYQDVGELVDQHGDTIDVRLPHVHSREVLTAKKHRQRIEAQGGRQLGAVLAHHLMLLGRPGVSEHAWQRYGRPRHHDALTEGVRLLL